jgi:hypothetical protein
MTTTTPAPVVFEQLKHRTQAELDDLFKQSPAGPIPDGEAKGEAIVFPGTVWARVIARFVHALAWKGKTFTRDPDGRGATLQNRITPAGVPLIVARVYYTESWLDGKECIVLDYSKTSLFAKKIRDEIRLIDPVNRIYLGKVWWGKTRLVDFALDFPG